MVQAEGEGKMKSLRLAVPTVLVAAVLAGCFTYFVTSPPRLEPGQRLPPPEPDVTASAPSPPAIIVQGRSAEDFQRAAEAILKRLPDTLAYAGADEPLITGHIPLPKRRRSRVHDQSRPPAAFGVKSRSEGVQCVSNENSDAQNNEECSYSLEH
jgi:hypothetical protein